MSNVSWIGTAPLGNWDNASNWSNNQVPQTGDDVTISVPAGGQTITYTNPEGTTGLNSVTIDGGTDSSALKLSQNQDTLSTDSLSIAPAAAGTVYDIAGTATLSVTNDATIGGASGAVGALNINDPGEGAVVGSSAQVTIGGNFVLGDSGIGYANLGGGSLNVGSLDLGKTIGFGDFYQEGGTLTTNALTVGDSGRGEYDNVGGTVTVNGNLIIANNPGGNGNFENIGADTNTTINFATLVSGDPLPVENGALVIGASGPGSFTQGAADQSDPGNTVSVAGDLVLGETLNGTGTYTLNDGTLTVDGRLVVGGKSTNDNTFTQNGGDVYVTGTASTDPNYVGVGDSNHAGSIFIGGGATIDGGTGTYALSGGSVNTGLIEVGHDGIGTFKQTGGVVNASVWLGNAGGTGFGGTYNLTGTGAINANFESLGLGENTNYFYQGDGDGKTINTINGTLEIGFNQGTATYTLSDGTVNAADIVVGDNYYGTGPSTGTFELDGGTVNVSDTLTVGNKGGTGTVNLTGSTLSAGAESIGGGSNLAVFNQTGGSNSVTGDLTVEAGGEYIYSGGTITAGDFINDGVLETTGTSADLTQDLNGTGEVLLTDGVEFGLSGQVAATQLVDFVSGQSATLDTTAFNNLGTIEGFTSGDTINVTGIPDGANFDGATAQYSQNAGGTGGTLAIYSGTDLLTVLNFTGGYSASDFILSGNSITTNFSPTDMIVDDTVPSSPYSIDTGSLNVTGNLIVGQTGNGEVDQGNGTDPTNTVSVDGELVLGQRNDSNGDVSHNYNLSDGTLTVGGQISIGGSLALTTGSPGIGGFYQTGGTVNALSGIYIGVDGAKGTPSDDNAFYINGGTDNVTGAIVVGELGQLDVLGGVVNADNIVNNHSIDLGGGTINSDVVNNAGASIEVFNYGATQEINGDISGSGNIDLRTASDLTLDGMVSNDQTITFDPAAETLNIDQLTGMNAQISGFSVGDVINLDNLQTGNYDYFSYSGDSNGGTLTILDASTNSPVATLNFSGDYQQSNFVLTGDQLTTNAPSSADVIVDTTTITPVSTTSGDYPVADNLIIGLGETGDFSQGDGSDTNNTVTVGNTVVLGDEFGSTGTYELNDGSLATENIDVGFAGTGTFTQSGGSISATNSVILNESGGYGTVNQTAGLAVIGVYYDGQTLPGGATPDANAGSLVVGGGTTNGSDAYNLGTTGQSNNNPWAGYPSSGLPSYDPTVDAPYLQVYGNTIIGRDSGSDGVFTLASDGSTFWSNFVAQTSDPNTGTGGSLYVGQNGTGEFDQTDDTIVYLDGALTLGQNYGSNGTYTLSAGDGTGGSLSVGNDLTIGGLGDGTFVQTAGTVKVYGGVVLGASGTVPNPAGDYQLNGTGGLTAASETVGGLGNGQFSQGQDGNGDTTNTVTGTLSVGDGILITNDPQTLQREGIYSLYSGLLAVQTAIIGNQGLGYFNQLGGTFTASAGLILGNQTSTATIDPNPPNETIGGPSNGHFTLSGGTLTVEAANGAQSQADTIVAASGSGTFVNKAGDHSTDALVIGENFGSTGIYTLTNSGTLNIVDMTDSTNTLQKGFLDVGESGGATYEQDGGTATISGALDGGRYATGVGTINIHGGSLTVGTFAKIGDAGNSTVTQDSQDSSSLVRIANELDIGLQKGSTGAYNIAGTSTLEVTNGPIYVGYVGTGSLTIGTEGSSSGATHVMVDGSATGDDLVVGFFGRASLTVHSGVLDVTNYLYVGEDALGTVTQDGGTVTASTLAMSSVNGDGSSTYAISGGTLSTQSFVVGHIGSSGTAQFMESGTANVGTETMTIAANGEYDFNGGALAASGIEDQGLFSVSGTQSVTTGAIYNSQSLRGHLDLTSGAALTVTGGTIGSNLDIDFASGAETLSVGDQVGALGQIYGFSGDDVINLLNQNFTSADHLNYVGTAGSPTTSGVLTITNASNAVIATLDFAGDYTTPEFIASGNSITICFYPGTRVSTLTGEVEVEKLAVGDLVPTFEGELKPIRWIGRQTISRAFADPLRVLPIRITAGALGENLPCRDLLVSPDHALLVDGVLVNASALVNGITIVRETDVPMTFTYYHVELEDHSLILAENVPAETFVDNVDRLNFDNWDEHLALYPNGYNIPEMTYPRAKSYRQMPMKLRHYLASLIASGVSNAA